MDVLLLSAIVQSTDDAIIGKSPEGIITSWNPGAEVLYGYTAAEAVGRHIFLCVPPERQAETADALGRVLHGERLAHYDTVRERKSGERIDVSVRVSPVLDEANRIVGASSISRDITERKWAERRERAEHAVTRIAAEAPTIEAAAPRLVQAVCDNLPVDLAVLYAADSDGRLQPLGACSNATGPLAEAAALLAFWPEEACHLRETIWFSDVPNTGAASVPDAAARLGFRMGFAVPVFRGEQCLVVMACYARKSLAAQRALVPTLGAIAQMVGQLVRRSRAEAELRSAVERRDHFLAMLSHELRNPFAAVRAASITLQRSSVPPDSQLATAVIVRQIQHMSRLLDGLLDVTRMTRDKLHLEPEFMDLDSAIAAAAEMVGPLARDSRVTLAVDRPREPLMLLGDRTRIAQLLANLLSNGVKYSSPGATVLLSVTREGDTAVIRVIDHGIGMGREVLERAFDLFYQADETLDRRASGMGVGLTLARTIAQLHGGTLSASSDGPGCGSEFTVVLPLVPAPEPAPAVSGDQHASERRYSIVVVEDNEDNREMVRLLLGYEGHRVDVASNGADGLAAIERVRPDVALVDIGLPGIDGFTVARRVRANADLDGVSLIALSGYALPSDVERAKAAGFDEHIAKPLMPEHLTQVLERIVASRESRTVPPSRR